MLTPHHSIFTGRMIIIFLNDCLQCFDAVGWAAGRARLSVCIWFEWSLTPHPTQYRSFRRRSSQLITWLVLANKTVQENTDKQTQYKSEKADNLKYSETKLTWFSCLLQHSARKRGGLILHRPRAHTGLSAARCRLAYGQWLKWGGLGGLSPLPC